MAAASLRGVDSRGFEHWHHLPLLMFIDSVHTAIQKLCNQKKAAPWNIGGDTSLCCFNISLW